MRQQRATGILFQLSGPEMLADQVFLFEMQEQLDHRVLQNVHGNFELN